MSNWLKIISLVFQIAFLPIVVNGQNDSTSNRGYKFYWYKLFPSEIKYGGQTEFQNYFNQFYINKNILVISKKHGFSGDGLNNVYGCGIAFSNLDQNNFISLFPYFGGLAWWEGHWFIRAEPYLNLQNGLIQYTNLEIGAGRTIGVSLNFCVPHNSSNCFYTGFKIGISTSNAIFINDRLRGWY